MGWGLGRKTRFGFSLTVPLLPLQVRKDRGETAQSRGVGRPRNTGAGVCVQVCPCAHCYKEEAEKGVQGKKEKGIEAERENTLGNNVRSICCIDPLRMYLWAAALGWARSRL